MTKTLLLTAAAATTGLLLALAAPARAQDAGAPAGGQPQPASGDAQPRVEYEKKTVINFEEDTIEGDLKRPDGEYIEGRKKVQHSNLIRIRENWHDKVMQSSSDL
ncbi:MAG: adventurous gliding motility protein CglF [Anaeromyxobacteraceae bacterium]